MKVLYCIRKNYLERLGGDSTQLLNTIKYICDISETFEYEIISDPQDIFKYSHYDMIHIFNMQNFSFLKEFILAAKKYNMRIALSTIYWDMSECLYVERMFRKLSSFQVISKLHPFKKLLTLNSPSKLYMGKEYKSKYHEVLKNVDLFLPNSDEEWNIIDESFKIRNGLVRVVPNALENIDYTSIVKENHNDDLRNAILVVGRIEPTKNQLAVLLACRDNKIPIVFVGEFSSSKYEKIIRKIANKRGNVYFPGKLSQKDVFTYYLKAKVHVLASFRESPGLATLEALRAGCNVVVSEKKYCPIEYYQFDKYAYICNPYSISSVKDAISRAYTEPVKEITDDYFNYYSYNNVAEITLNAYDELMRLNKDSRNGACK